MKNFKVLLFAILFSIFSNSTKADEGMWLLSLLNDNIEEMKKMGCELSPEQIYNINQSSIKDAVVGLGRAGRDFSHFCTAEIISGQGLMLTNHHCSFGLLQSHSSPQNDILTNGFWAKTNEEEIVNKGITASILVSMEEVTDKILSEVHDNLNEEERTNAIREISRQLEKEAVEGTHYKARVRDIFHGNRYFLFVHEIFEDVRIVGAPPQSMGKFGGDTDNWEWPRHTADFSVLRVYTAPDGKPAPYAEENIPLKPRHFLPVSLKGVSENDFAMVMGFPGSTNRFLTSYGIDRTMNIYNANRYNIRTKKLNVLRKEMKKSDEKRIKYASKFARSANYWKYSNEQNKALKKLKTKENKQALEQQFTQWVTLEPERKAKYGDALDLIAKSVQKNKNADYLRLYLREALLAGPDLPIFSRRAMVLEEILDLGDAEKINFVKESMKENSKTFFRDFDPETEKKLIATLFEDFSKHIPANQQPDFFKKIKGNNFSQFASKVVDRSLFSNPQKFYDFLKDPSIKKLKKDPSYSMTKSITGVYNNIQTSTNEYSMGMRKYVAGLLEMQNGKKIAPDANSTLRLSYGKIMGYEPRDGISYKYFTTLKGVMEKEDDTSTEFFVDDRVENLFKQKDYGRYACSGDALHTCFITNHDITGGNSGSPVLNAKGELIGIAFDGNSEAMSGDIDFEENLQRCINVDIRYVLWVIDKYAGASHLIEEMKIAN